MSAGCEVLDAFSLTQNTNSRNPHREGIGFVEISGCSWVSVFLILESLAFSEDEGSFSLILFSLMFAV